MISRSWAVELDRHWDVLGPFPVHAREQHFLSPAYPLDLSLPISTATRYPTSLTHTAYASWSKTTADQHGTIRVSHPSVSWDQIRATEGWAGLQHMNLLRGWLSIVPPSDTPAESSEPLLRTELLQGAFFAILPPPDSPERATCVPEWHHGNIYTLERAPAQLVRLPVSPAKGMMYEVIICAPYEIRLFGDPSAYSSAYPILTLNFSASLQFPYSPTPSLAAGESQHPVDKAPLQYVRVHSVSPHIVDGTPFGDAIGIGVQCLDFRRDSEDGPGDWSVVDARLVPNLSNLPTSLSVALLNKVRIAPTQTCVIPLRLSISSLERIPREVERLDIELICVPLRSSSSAHHNTRPTAQRTFALRTSLPLTHIPLWTEEDHVPIHATFFFAKSMPTTFVAKPPRNVLGEAQVDANKCRGNEPILALHGAGVDILTQSFWADSLMRQQYAWVLIPQGRTAWGLDWHGPSADDAFATISALSNILSTSGSTRWAKWSFDTDTRVILMGHSNGGQGAWYIASRWPDRVCAVVPASGYIKSQAYVPWSMSRFAHFVDPALRAVLDSSLTPDDNDLFLGNLVGKPVLALQGGADDNVPPWHTREQVGILKTWDPQADVTYHEDPGRPHWYIEILFNDRVQAFLDRVYFSSPSSHSGLEVPRSHEVTKPECKTQFNLTVAVPSESGPLKGWQVHALAIPGLLGRLRATTPPNGRLEIQTTNIAVFSLASSGWVAAGGSIDATKGLTIDGSDIPLDLSNKGNAMFFVKDVGSAESERKPLWKALPSSRPPSAITHRLQVPRQRLQSVLSTHAPLTLLVPSLAPSQELSAALRIAHALFLFHALDAHIVSVPEVEAAHAQTGIQKGNLVVVGCAETALVRGWLERAGGLWTYADGAWCVGAAHFERPSSAILFCHPHPYDARGVALFVQSTDASGLERAVRLFPIRTGVLSPDWIVVDGRADAEGAAGVQGAGVYGWPGTAEDMPATGTGKWVWNERMSWLDV